MEGYSQDTCHAYVASMSTSYGYVPSKAAAIAFVVFFGVSMVAHMAQTFVFRTWWCAVFSIGCLGMWITRYKIFPTTRSLIMYTSWASWLGSPGLVVNLSLCPNPLHDADHDSNHRQVLFQVTLSGNIQLMIYELIAPTFFTAGIYIILARLVGVFGPSSSSMSPKLYVWVFCICDVISLAAQGAGGAMASSGGGGGASSSASTATSSSSSAAASASSVARSLLARATESSNSSSSQTTGTHVMVAGIIFQLVSITLFVGCAADLAWRIHKQSPRAVRQNKPLLLLGAATTFSLLLIYIRSVYRTIELLHGWTSSTMRNEKLLIGLDGAMMVPAVMIYNLIHPSHLLPKISQNTNYFKPESYQMDFHNDPFENPRYEKNDNATLLDRTWSASSPSSDLIRKSMIYQELRSMVILDSKNYEARVVGSQTKKEMQDIGRRWTLRNSWQCGFSTCDKKMRIYTCLTLNSFISMTSISL